MKTCVKTSVNQVFDPPIIDDPHYITFTRYVNEVHDPTKREIYEPKVNKCLKITHDKTLNSRIFSSVYIYQSILLYFIERR